MACSLARLHRSFLVRPTLSRRFRLSSISLDQHQRQFIPQQLGGFEPVEEYRPGGFHPMSIGDEFAHGRYRVIHKLGFGGSSTIWLARDQQNHPGVTSRLVTLKAMRADVSSKSPNDLPEIAIPKSLQAAFREGNNDFQTVQDHFMVQGPNGNHRFLISPLAGPSVLAMLQSPSARRLRRDLAVKVAKQTTSALRRMHSLGFAHGDLTTSNILFRMSEEVLGWSDDEVYDYFGHPETEGVTRIDRRPGEPNAPPTLDYKPGTILNYISPEMRFDGRTAGLQTDIWALGCAIFEFRAGFPLFESFFGSDVDILKQAVETLGRLPDPWWGSFEERTLWFEEDGEPKAEAQERAEVFLQSSKSSIRDKLRSIGMPDDAEWVAGKEGPMAEKSGVKMPEEEIELLGDLLEKMLRYLPEERIAIEEVVKHPWFEMRL
ncbi:kinase-like domain-containing protein [Roridomyces roridus]|uniref:non-specific serine/threonine protein kinase n=1 Tax=Roridomyces roridus TaxID=1738132 RepID=A0AAD7FHU1_9AGAR|nr:kinase-like domain-containing protein [Roridomyces roridus]